MEPRKPSALRVTLDDEIVDLALSPAPERVGVPLPPDCRDALQAAVAPEDMPLIREIICPKAVAEEFARFFRDAAVAFERHRQLRAIGLCRVAQNAFVLAVDRVRRADERRRQIPP